VEPALPVIVEIGSVPGTDPAAAVEEALRLCPEMPSVPEMPQRDPLEGMVPRVLEAFPFVADAVRGRLSVDAEDPALRRAIDDSSPRLPSSARAAGLIDLLRARSRAPDLPAVKAAVIGPVALARALRDPTGRRLSDVPEVADAVTRFLSRMVLHLGRALRGWATRPVVQVDEPGTTDSLDADETRRVRSVLAAARLTGGLAALHDCGARLGTGFVTLAAHLDFALVDASREDVPLLGSDRGLSSYFRSGGKEVVWGIVPTDGRPPPSPSAKASLLERATRVVGDADLVRHRSHWSPACGLGALDAAGARRVREALAAIASA
jgi:hypothetical protein